MNRSRRACPAGSDVVVIRRLRRSDAAAYRAIRLRMLRDHPDAFLESHAEGKRKPVAVYAERLAASPILGGFVHGQLAGTVGWFRETSAKARHKVTIWGVYTAPEHRGRGLAARLLDETLRRIRKTPGIRQVRLDVGTWNRAARALYAAAGFRSFGIERNALRVGSSFVHEELMVLFLTESRRSP